MLIALDPSSTCLGLAASVAGEFISAGRIKPRASDPAQTRIDAIIERLLERLAKFRSDYPAERIIVVIEISSGKVNQARHGGGGVGLATYGDAVGSIRTAVRLKGYSTAEIPENLWTGGHSKDKRKRVAKTHCPSYDATKDAGGDIADAICLALWYARKHPELR